MAFVMGKAQKKSVFQEICATNQVPGPNSYNTGGKGCTGQYPAPFNGSQLKVSCFQVKQQNYGPGYYEPAYYKDLNKIDTKLSSGCVFNSKVQRFTIEDKKNTTNKIQNSQNFDLSNKNCKKNNSISEQTYYTSNETQGEHKSTYAEKLNKSKSVMKQLQKQNYENRVQSIKGKRDFIRVILTSSTNTQNIESRYVYKNIKGKTLGPGSYENAKAQSKRKSVTDWSRQRKVRFKTQVNMAPGPGYYQVTKSRPHTSMDTREKFIQNRKNKKMTSSFASSVIRSHMDAIIYKTNIPLKAAIMQDRKIKDTQPGPGSYNLNKNNKNSFNYGKNNIFGVSKQKIKEHQNLENEPGPGDYQINKSSIALTKQPNNKIVKQIRNQIFGKKGKIADNFNKDNSLHHSYSQRHQPQNPQPCFVEPTQSNQKNKKLTKFCSLKQRCFSRLGTMSQQERFKKNFKKTEEQQPGPGEYYSEVYSQFSIRQGLRKGVSSVFQSSSKRIASEQSESVPYYNVAVHDIGSVAEKTKKYLQNLQKINVIKSPFHTSSKRFEQQQIQLNIGLPKQSYEEDAYIYNERKIQPSSAFKSGTKRDTFDSPEKPGPADYKYKVKTNGSYLGMQKQSFNKYYSIGRPKNQKKNNKEQVSQKQIKIETTKQ